MRGLTSCFIVGIAFDATNFRRKNGPYTIYTVCTVKWINWSKPRNEVEYTRTQNIINIGNISTSIPASYFNDRKLYACLRFWRVMFFSIWGCWNHAETCHTYIVFACNLFLGSLVVVAALAGIDLILLSPYLSENYVLTTGVATWMRIIKKCKNSENNLV